MEMPLTLEPTCCVCVFPLLVGTEGCALAFLEFLKFVNKVPRDGNLLPDSPTGSPKCEALLKDCRHDLSSETPADVIGPDAQGCNHIVGM